VSTLLLALVFVAVPFVVGWCVGALFIARMEAEQ
jgi:hypothetical protein